MNKLHLWLDNWLYEKIMKHMQKHEFNSHFGGIRAVFELNPDGGLGRMLYTYQDEWSEKVLK